MRSLFMAGAALVLLVSLSSPAEAQPLTSLVGAWRCQVDDAPAIFVTFNRGGTFSATGPILSISGNYGAWRRTGLHTFVSRDLAFRYDADGVAVLVEETRSRIEMSDNDNLSAELDFTLTDLDGSSSTIPQPPSISTTCTRVSA